MTEHEPTSSTDLREDENQGETALYLYGIGLIPSGFDWNELQPLIAESAIQVRTVDELAAFTREVPLSDYSEEVLQSRVQDQEWLMQEVQQHHHVIAELSQSIPLLPATFGTLYASDDALLESLRSDSEALTERLRQVEGCDEWALHVYRDESGIKERVLAEDPELRRMSEELEGAATGRAYLLRQQMEKRLSRAIEEQQLAIADSLLDGVRDLVREFNIEDPRSTDQTGQDDVEIARASLLVPRDDSEVLLNALSEAADSAVGIRLEVSGPWPVYSFAQVEAGA